jgi:sterol desaturase/sphingolipid hydroxylase (fatty acid hydroxylase superfamily)
MKIFTLEHSPAAYRADFILYALASIGLALYLVLATPADQAASVGALAVAGVLGWTLAEYLLHRFVLHGLPPFKGWHTLHHQRPTALMGSPTLLSASLFGFGVFLPTWWLAGWLMACAATFGLQTGYLLYALVHHATHHPRRALSPAGRWRTGWLDPWLLERRRWHALHHSPRQPPCHFGVTSGVWDRVFGNTARLPVASPPARRSASNRPGQVVSLKLHSARPADKRAPDGPTPSESTR